MTSRFPHIGLGLTVDGDRAGDPPASDDARFVEIAVDAALPDLETLLLDDPFAPAPTAGDYYALQTPPALPCVAHAGAVGPLSTAELDHLARTVAARGARWLSAEAVGLSAGCALDPVPLPLTAAAVDEVAARAHAIAARVAVPFVVSTAPLLFAVGELHFADFFAAVVARSGCDLRLDLGHLLAYQVSRGHAAEHRLDALPLDRIVALHLGLGVIVHTHGVAHYRTDSSFGPELLALLTTLVRRCPSLRAISLRGPEGDRSPAPALSELARLLASAGFAP